MGAFFKYETSMARLFEINTTTSKITRPNRKIKKADILGAFIVIDGASVFPLSVSESAATGTEGDLAIVITVDGTNGPELGTLSYDLSADSFALGETSLTNIMIDGFGKVVTA